jgi:hypothetical protein
MTTGPSGEPLKAMNNAMNAVVDRFKHKRDAEQAEAARTAQPPAE